ncbi:MAG: hypothetical protein ACOYB3_00115 [Azonexus sp.]
MGRTKEIVEKYGLRDICAVRGVVGQKMDEDCIQAFIDGDPSGNGKYLDWMILQAGGGKERLDKSVTQWEAGDHGEQPVRDTLRKTYIEDAVKGYIDDDDKRVSPVTEEVAIAQWEESGEQFFRGQHVYGDEEYVLTGFGFYRSWPGHNAHYEQIVQSVSRFHRYQSKLKSLSKSVDLNAASYPNLRDLQAALADITFLEIKNHLDYDTVFEDENLTVICPFNIGASMKFGHQKWCTANESMFKTAIAGSGPNRWKEYAKDAALYYCRFHARATVEHEVGVGKVSDVAQVAIQAPFKGSLSSWKFFDTTDSSLVEREASGKIGVELGFQASKSWRQALDAVTAHYKRYPKSRLNLEFVVRK